MTQDELLGLGLSRREAVAVRKNAGAISNEGTMEEVQRVKAERQKANRKAAGFNGLGRYGKN